MANAVDALVERHRRLGRGGATALVDDRGAWTFDELSGASARAAGALRARGVRPGDRVAVTLPDGREAVAALLGAMRMGAIAVPLDGGMSPARVAAVLADCAPAAVVDRPTAGPSAPEAPAPAEHPAALTYTSGTTGAPKGVVHAHGAFAADAPGFLRDGLGVGPGDRCLVAAPTATALGFFIGLTRPLVAGATAVVCPGTTSARRILAAVEAHGATVLAAVPALWLQVAAVLERRPGQAGRLSGLRWALSSGDRMPAGLSRRVAAAGVPPLIDGLGSSECADIVAASTDDLPGFRRVTPGVTLCVADGAGAPRPAGAPGTLWVRTPAAAHGYWGRPEAGAALRRGSWLRTEDVAVRRDGALHLLGRRDELFTVAGRLVSPAEIERAVAADPRVAEAAVIAAAGAGGRVRPAAFVVPVAGAAGGPALARDLRRSAARRLGPTLAPARVVVMDALPRHPSGKLDRRSLARAA